MSYLTCSLLEQWPHGFFTHDFWPSLPAELVAALQPQARVYRVKQVHGNAVLSTGEFDSIVGDLAGDGISEAAELPAADGLLTVESCEAVWVASADCTPVLIADIKTGQVAALHAGWRGTAAKIVPTAIARLQAEGSQLSDLRLALGPAISGEVYQVSLEVAAEIGTTIAATNHGDNAATIVERLHQIPTPPVLADPVPGRVRLDVRRAIALQVEQMGITVDRVAIAPYCTYSLPEHFFSYRRDNIKKVQWSGIVSI